MAESLPVYDWKYPALMQQHDYDCSEESAHWQLKAWGRNPDEAWIENSLISQGVMTPQYGLMDASGAGLAAWFNTEYGMYGYVSSNDGSVSFDEVAQEVRTHKHPVQIGGRAFYHWVGCRSYDAGSDTLMLANPAPGYKGVYQSLTRAQWNSLGSWSLVRLCHPQAESGAPPPQVPPLETPITDPGSEWAATVGSGILEMMQADGDTPACPSTWLPLGQNPAVIEECTGMLGTVYRFHVPSGRRWRYQPDTYEGG